MRNPVYLDHHSTTPCDPRVVEKMLPYFSEHFGNASATQHTWGQTAAQAVEEARERVARLIGASPREIVFTSGATEAIHLALLGAVQAHRDRGRHLVTAATEHKAVLETHKALAGQGFDVTVLPVDRYGAVDVGDVRKAIRPDTILLSFMSANNEIGTMNPLTEIGRIAKETGVLLLCDAVQSAGKLPVDVERDGIDLSALSAHKLYGPKGIGALYVRGKNPRVRIARIVYGGGQERGLRSGTLNVPGIVGFGEACVLAVAALEGEADRQRGLRDRLRDRLFASLDGIELNGHPTRRLPNNLSVSIRGADVQALLRSLADRVAVSSGASCTANSVEPSHVLLALGLEPDLARNTIRFGVGRANTPEEIDFVADLLIEHVRKLRRDAP